MSSPSRDDSSIYNELNLSPTRGFPSILLKIRGATKDCAIELEPECTAPDPFSSTPIELCLHILSFVEQPWYLCDIAKVSSHWNMLASENQLWYSFYIKYRFVLEDTDEMYSTTSGYWKSKFREKYQRITPWYLDKFKEDTFDNPFSTLCRIHLFSGKALVAVQLIKVSLMDVETFQEKDSTQILSIASCSIPSRNMVALFGDHVQILKVDCSSMKLTKVYETKFNFVSRDSLAHNRDIVACTQNDSMWVLDLDTLTSQTIYTEHSITGIFVEAHGQYNPQHKKKKSKVGAVLSNGNLVVWDLTTSEAIIHITEDTIMNHAGMSHHPVNWKVVQCAFLKNDLLILGMDQGRMQVWNLVTKTCVDTIQAHNHTITFFEETSYDELFLSAAQDGTLKTWNINSLKEVEVFILIHVPELFQSYDGVRIRDVISTDTRLCAISHMGKVKMWDIKTGKIMFVTTLNAASLLACNDSFLVFGSLSKITIRNYQQTQQVPSLCESTELQSPKIVSVSSVGKRKRTSKAVSPPPLIVLDDSDEAEELHQLQEFRKQHAAWLVETDEGKTQEQ